jgi:hypothetical protein
MIRSSLNQLRLIFVRLLQSGLYERSVTIKRSKSPSQQKKFPFFQSEIHNGAEWAGS